jgi:hypothetical protein
MLQQQQILTVQIVQEFCVVSQAFQAPSFLELLFLPWKIMNAFLISQQLQQLTLGKQLN